MRIKRGVVCKVPGWEPCGLLTNVTLPLFITSHPGPYTANWMVISFDFKRYRYKNAHNGQEITESHNGMAWTGEHRQSGRVWNSERFRTAPATGRTRKSGLFWALCSGLGHRGPRPQSLFLPVQNGASKREPASGFHFHHTFWCNYIFYLAVVVNSLQ